MKERKTINTRLWLIKNLSILSLILIVFLHGHFSLIGVFQIRILNIQLIKWILGYSSSYVFAFLIHLVVFKLVLNSKPTKKVEIKSLIENWFVFCFFLFLQDMEGRTKDSSKLLYLLKAALFKLVSPDYSFANTFKVLLWRNELNPSCPIKSGGSAHKNNSTKSDIICEVKGEIYECELASKRNRRKDFVIYSNWMNVLLACIICFLAIYGNFKSFLIPFLFFHLLSRLVEVVYAFYSDVVRVKMFSSTYKFGYKSSSLKKGNRISLAVHSYFEFILLFACVYFLLSGSMNGVLSEGSHSFLDYLLYSMSVSAYNFSFDINSTTLGKLLHVSQVFTSMTLIVLSVASYIGMKDEMSEMEIVEWVSEDYC